MAARTYELKLTELPVPEGEIDVRDLVAILEPLRLAALRVARQVGGSARTGRTESSLDSAGGLRFKASRAGSTVLEFTLGDAESLPGMPDENLIAERFEELGAAIAANEPPEWITPPIAAACRRASVALRACGAKSFILSRTDGLPHDIASSLASDLDTRVWRVAPETAGMRTVSGRLDMVDLREGHFRVRDDVGNDIHLLDVADADTASTLVGQRVTATGAAELDHNRRLRLVEPTIAADVATPPWTDPPRLAPTVGVRLADMPHIDVSDEEIEEFLKALRS